MSSRTIRWIAVGVAATLVATFAVMTATAYASVVTGVTASPSPLTAGAAAIYTVNFSTSITGGLAAGSGTITLTGPPGTQFPLTDSDYSVNGNLVTATPTITPGAVTITTPILVSSSSPVVVEAGLGTTATNPTAAGTDTISVSTSLDITPVVSSPGYIIGAGAASQVVVTGGGSQTATVGTTFTNPLNATIEDSYGNAVQVQNTTVVFTAPASGASGTFFNGTNTDSTATGSNGVAITTPFTAGTGAGTYSVTASSVGLTSASFTETNMAGAASVDVVTAGGGQSTSVGTVFATSLSITIEDSHGNPVLVPGTSVTFTAPGSGASGTFANGTDTTIVTTGGNGVATATTFTANDTADSAGGTYAVSAQSAGATAATFNETNVAGAAAQDVVLGGNGQSAAAGSAFATPLSVTIEDSHGNPVLVPGTTVTFTAPASGASGTFANGTGTAAVVTNGNGVATTVRFTAGMTVGTYTVTAGSAGSTPAGFSETNVAGVPGAPTGLTAVLGDTTVALAWNGPLSNGGSPITGYNVYEGTTSGGESATPVSGSGLTECSSTSGPSGCTVTGLANGTAYYFTVRAVNAVGPSFASNGASATPAVSPPGGYDLAAADGGVFALGSNGFYGSEGGQRLTKPIVGSATMPDGKGYWEVASDGGVFTFGDAHFYGSEGGKPLTKPIVGMATTADGGGYWLVASDGGIFAFGDAHFYGSEGGKRLNRPIVGMAGDPATGGYWEVASDGGIFSFDAPFAGSMGGTKLTKPIVGMSADTVTGGYWEVASDGGIFSFGGALFHGSEGGKTLNRPIVGMAGDPATGGYWEVASDGGIFSFDAPFAGSMGGTKLSAPIVGMAIG